MRPFAMRPFKPFVIGQSVGGVGSTPSPALWTPAQLSELVVWLDADDAGTITTVGSNVSQWDDKSGNGNHATQTVGSQQPTYEASLTQAGGLPSIRSTTTSGRIGLLLPSVGLQEVYVTIYRNDTADSTWNAFSRIFGGDGNQDQWRVVGNSNQNALNTSAQRFNDAGAFKNGSATGSDTVLPMPLCLFRFAATAARTQNYSLGYSLAVNGRGFDGGYRDFVGVSNALSMEDRQKLEGYLAHKSKLESELPSGHPYKSSAPTV